MVMAMDTTRMLVVRLAGSSVCDDKVSCAEAKAVPRRPIQRTEPPRLTVDFFNISKRSM